MSTLPSQPAPIDVLILGAGFTTDNRGVAALACGTLASIYHSFPNATVAFLDYAKTPAIYPFRHQNRVHPIGFVALRFSKNVFCANHVLRLLLTAVFVQLLPQEQRTKLITRNPWLRAIARADLIGALSGGDSFSSLYGLRRLLYVSLPQLLVLALRRPLTLLPQSYGPFQHWSSRYVARKILRGAARIFSRDVAGLETIRALAPDAASRAAFAYDMGFALEPHTPPPPLAQTLADLHRRGQVVGLNVSGLLYNTEASPGNPFNLTESYRTLMKGLVEELVLKKGVTIILIPHVLGAGGESDVTASQDLMSRLSANVSSSVTIIGENCDQHEVKYVIGQCHFFIGARMHACIAALSQSVPAVALAYSDKFAGVLASIGDGYSLVDLRTTKATQVFATIAQAYDQRTELSSKLEMRRLVVLRSVLEFFRAQNLIAAESKGPVDQRIFPWYTEPAPSRQDPCL